MIPNRKRMDTVFKQLVSIRSMSTKEEQLITFLERQFKEWNMKVVRQTIPDVKYGSITNLVTTIEGDSTKEAIFFCTHLDTVFYESTVKLIEDANNYYSDGSTILGADPKMAITCMYELMSLLNENKVSHPTIQFIFTSAEEIGCIGANYLIDAPITAKSGYVVDHDGQVGTIVHAAYSHALVKLKFTSATNDGISTIAKQIIKQMKNNLLFKQTILSTRSLQTDIQDGIPVVHWNIDLYGDTDEQLAGEIDHLY